MNAATELRHAAEDFATSANLLSDSHAELMPLLLNILQTIVDLESDSPEIRAFINAKLDSTSLASATRICGEITENSNGFQRASENFAAVMEKCFRPSSEGEEWKES